MPSASKLCLFNKNKCIYLHKIMTKWITNTRTIVYMYHVRRRWKKNQSKQLWRRKIIIPSENDWYDRIFSLSLYPPRQWQPAACRLSKMLKLQFITWTACVRAFIYFVFIFKFYCPFCRHSKQQNETLDF